MTPRKFLFTATMFAVIAFRLPATAQTVHVAAASGSSQFLSAALGADLLARKEISDNVAGGIWSAGQKTTFHWSGKNAAKAIDSRDVRITPEPGNIWVVWIGDASDSNGNTNVTDIWTAISLDATTATRQFSAQQSSGSGGQLQVVPGATSNLISPSSLWADGKADVPSLLNAPIVSNAIGTSNTGGVHFNVALTDLRPEDALFATTRALATLNTSTWAGLGYKGVTPNIGASILTAQGTGTFSTPIKFALSGANDPISHIAVPAYSTIPVGASPFIFVLNNGGAFSSSTANLTSGVGGIGPFPLANLFDGTTTADTHNAAFGGNNDQAGTPLILILREPISAAANVVEFTLFRTTKNNRDSQEKGVVNPLGGSGNPLNQGTPVHGVRKRANSTSEVVSALQNNPNSLGYIAFSFANASKLSGANWNYLTIDGVDPLSIPGTVNQDLPNGATTTATAVWPSTRSYPNLRNGTYKAWALERYLVADSDSDPYGPTALAQSEQDNIDSTVADFVPFCTSDLSDGLDVYRSHYTQSAVKGNNGQVSPCGTSLGGTNEKGGDVGGLIEGPFGVSVDSTGNVITSAVNVAGKGYRVTWKNGSKFTAGAAWKGLPIVINGNNFNVSTTVAPTATVLYVTSNPGTNTSPVPYSLSSTSPDATTPGALNKKQ